MANESASSRPGFRLDPTQPMTPESEAFARQLNGMLDGQPKDEATVSKAFDGMEGMFDLIAAGLYSIASMLVGEGEESIGLVETAIANAEVSACSQPEDARRSSRRALVSAALRLLVQRNPGSLAAPEDVEHAATCIEDDDLDAAGISRAELERMMAGPDRARVRTWLESLPAGLRTIFVLRAVAGFNAVETAELLTVNGGPQAQGWSPEAVRELFRQALCSLASQLIQAGVRS